MNREMTTDFVVLPIDLALVAEAFTEQYLKQLASASPNNFEPAAS